MNRVTVLKRLQEIYEEILHSNSVKLYFEHQTEIDQQFSVLYENSTDSYSPQEMEMLRVVAQLHEKLIDLLENKKIQTKQLNQVSKTAYSFPRVGESYFVDKKS